MNLEIIDTPLSLDVYGFSGTAINKDYASKGLGLMNKMWQIVKSRNLKNKGINIWIYEENEKMFAGVEVDDTRVHETEMEHKTITIPKYAYYKHIGPYSLLRKAGADMSAEVKRRGLFACLPYVEIYGHWTEDESKLETELVMCLK